MNALNIEAAEFLVTAQALIANPEHWTQGTFVRNKAGASTYTDHPDAYCYCAVGAMIAMAHRGVVSEEAYDIAYKELESHTTRGIPHFNDNGTHPLVMNLFTNTIENLRKKA